jgi:hypothetical protein
MTSDANGELINHDAINQVATPFPPIESSQSSGGLTTFIEPRL